MFIFKAYKFLILVVILFCTLTLILHKKKIYFVKIYGKDCETLLINDFFLTGFKNFFSTFFKSFLGFLSLHCGFLLFYHWVNIFHITHKTFIYRHYLHRYKDWEQNKDWITEKPVLPDKIHPLETDLFTDVLSDLKLANLTKIDVESFPFENYLIFNLTDLIQFFEKIREILVFLLFL